MPLAALLAVGCAVLASAAPAAAAAGPAATLAGPALDSEKIALAYVQGNLDLFDVVKVTNPQSQPLRQIALPLMAGAQNVQVRTGADPATARVAHGALVLPLRLPPQGHATVSFSYTLPAPRLPVSLVRSVDFPTAQFDVVMRADQLSLRTQSLAPMGTAKINGLSVRQFGAAAIPPGTRLAFTAVAAPGWLQQEAAAFTPTVWIVVASCALAALLAVGMRRDAAGRGA